MHQECHGHDYGQHQYPVLPARCHSPPRACKAILCESWREVPSERHPGANLRGKRNSHGRARSEEISEGACRNA